MKLDLLGNPINQDTQVLYSDDSIARRGTVVAANDEQIVITRNDMPVMIYKHPREVLVFEGDVPTVNQIWLVVDASEM
jgi:hypothetical protein